MIVRDAEWYCWRWCTGLMSVSCVQGNQQNRAMMLNSKVVDYINYILRAAEFKNCDTEKVRDWCQQTSQTLLFLHLRVLSVSCIGLQTVTVGEYYGYQLLTCWWCSVQDRRWSVIVSLVLQPLVSGTTFRLLSLCRLFWSSRNTYITDLFSQSTVTCSYVASAYGMLNLLFLLVLNTIIR